MRIDQIRHWRRTRMLHEHAARRAARRSKSYGAVRALRDGDLALRARRGARADGRERRRQVHAREGARRRHPARRRRDARRRRSRPTSTRPHDARDAGIAVIYQEPTLFPDLSIAENVVMGYHPLGSLRRIDRARDAPRRAGAARPPRRAARSRPPGARAVDRRPADRRDRQGAELRRPRPDHGRADGRAVGRRGRAAVHGRPDAARGGRGDPVHLAPPRGGVRDLRHRHRDARRRRRPRRADRRDDARRDGPADGRAAS